MATISEIISEQRNIENLAFHESNASGLPGTFGGPADAYRHLIIAAELTRRYGAEIAEIMLQGHKLDPLGREVEQGTQDFHNNPIGQDIGRVSHSYDETVRLAREAISNGREGTTDSGTPTWLPSIFWRNNDTVNPDPTKWNWPTNPNNPDGPSWPLGPYPLPSYLHIPAPGPAPSLSHIPVEIGKFLRDLFFPSDHADEIDLSLSDLYKRAQRWLARRDPLAFDLDGDGLETVGANATNPILFDHDGDGLKTGTGWVKPDDGFLVLDRNNNGIIDNGRELFGDSTPLANGGTATDGFAALAQEDTNNDGKVDSNDARFNQLRIWRDLNQDGVSQSNELFTLTEVGIASITVAKTTNAQTLVDGNQIADLGNYTRLDGSTGTLGEVGRLADVNLVDDTFHRQFTDQIALAPGVEALPNMQGSGRVRDLSEAASLSTDLKGVLGQFAEATTREAQLGLLDEVLRQWADTSGLLDMRGRADGKFELFFQAIGSERYLDHLNLPSGMTVTITNTSLQLGGGGASLGSLVPEGDAAYEALIDRWVSQLHVLEAFNGRYFFQFPGETAQAGESARSGLTTMSVSTDNTPGGTAVGFGPTLLGLNFSVDQVNLLQQSYQSLRESVYGSLVMQTRLKPYLNEISLSVDDTGLHLDLSGINARFEAQRAIDPINALTDLIELNRYGGPSLYPSGWNGLETLGNVLPAYSGDASVQTLLNQLNVRLVSDTGNGNSQSDILIGSSAADSVYGNDGNDLMAGSGGNDNLYGGNGNDVLDGGAGNDYLRGDAGNDTYLFGRGSGQDTVYSYDPTVGKVDTIQLGANVTPAEVIAKRSGTDLVLTIAGTTDKLTVGSYFNSDANSPYKVEQIVFADGSVWDVATVKAKVQLGTEAADVLYGYAIDDTLDGGAGADTLYGAEGNDVLAGGLDNDELNGENGNDTLRGDAGNDNLYGGNGNDVLDGGAGNDYLRGDAGNDTYLFGRGSGQDTVYSYDPTVGKVDTIQLSANVTPADLIARRSSSDLILTIAGTTDKLTVSGYFTSDGSTPYKVEQIVFADGSVWDVATLKAKVQLGTEAADVLYGYASDDTLDGGAGADTLYGAEGNDVLAGGLDNDDLNGENGNDTYLFGRGSGQDTVYSYDPTVGKVDTIQLSPNVTPAEVIAKRLSFDLVLTIAGTTRGLRGQARIRC